MGEPSRLWICQPQGRVPISAMSSPVITPITPLAAFAAEASTLLIFACATSERSM